MSVLQFGSRKGRLIRSFALSLALGIFLAGPLIAENIDSTMFGDLGWRSIGPATMGGRITDIAGVPGDPALFYVASASSGLFKTINGGTTFEPIFENQPVLSIGAIALAPTNPDVIYVGTGEGNVRNTVSFGNGIYKTYRDSAGRLPTERMGVMLIRVPQGGSR